VTYILPSALGGSEADGSCPPVGDTGPTPPKLGARALPNPGREATAPVRAAPPPGPRPVPKQRHPLTAPAPGGPAPTWRGRWLKVSPGRGEGGSAPSSLPKRPALEGGKGRRPLR